MAEKTIGIRINLNGLNGVVKDIQTLEKFINEAREDLKQLEIGSEQFNLLSAEISRATGQLQTLNRTSEAISPEKITEGFGKLAGGITSSFAAATAAVSLFGNESEAVQEAATKAQNLLTLALSVRGIMEIKTGAQIVARTIAEKASAAATLATDSATKALYTTLAANPYGAILAVVGLLVTAFLSFADSTSEAEKAQKEFYDSVAKEASKSIASFERLAAVINDQTQSYQSRKKALEELQSQFPGYFKNLRDEEILSGRVKVAIDGVRDAIVNKALAQALEQKLAEKLAETTEERIKLSEKELVAKQLEAEATRQIAKAEEEFNAGLLKGEAFTNRVRAASQLNNQASSIRVGILKEKAVLDEKDRKNTEAIILSIQELSKSYDNVFVEEKKVTTQTVQLTEAQKKNQATLEKSIGLQIEYVKSLVATSKELGQVSKVDVGVPKVVKELQDLITARKAADIPTLGDEFKKVGLLVGEAGGKFGVFANALDNYRDVFGEFYDSIRETLASGAITQTTEQFANTINTILTDASKKLATGEITKEAFESLKGIVDQYKQFNKLIELTPETQKVFDESALKDYLNTVKNISIAQGDILFDYDELTGKISKVDASTVNLGKALQDQIDAQNTFKNNLIKFYTDKFKLDEKNYEETVNRLLSEGKITKDQQKTLLEDRKKGAEEIKKIFEDLANTQIASLDKIVSTVITEENQIRSFLAEVQKLREEGQKQSVPKVIADVLVKNLELTRQFAKFEIDERKTTQEQLLQLEKGFSDKGLLIAEFTEEQKLAILKFYLQKQKEEKDAAAEDDKKRGKITVESTIEVLQQFGNLLNRAASVTSQYYAFQLKQLEDSSKKALESVTGDTEEANKKRLELESQYQKQKAEIEKRAQVRALQIQLAQAIADGAQAVLSVIEVPPLAIAVGLLAAAQIALIAQQLAYVQSLAGGGRIKMGAGGMVMGPAHEYGGVSYANGVNLEGGESVINRQSSLNYGGLLSTINQAGGGAPLINNASNSLMEERLLQAIAKTKNEPIRAYVLSSEITNSQAINRKLDELSTI